ncbi:MAG: hydrolase, partial [bacterium]
MPRPLFIQNATLFDGASANSLPATSILISEGRIAAVGSAAQLVAPDGAEVIDGTGKFVIPGLIDMHVHVELSGGEDALAAWLGTGVTTIRDVGASPEGLLPLRDAVAAGDQVGPRIFSYGPLLDGVPPIF